MSGSVSLMGGGLPWRRRARIGLFYWGARGLGRFNRNSAGTEMRDQVEDISEDPTTEDTALAVLDDGLGERAVVRAATGRVSLRGLRRSLKFPKPKVTCMPTAGRL